ncbi:hypothetical protein EDB85DRAFT_1887615 [Lactarius pseudohatsudake]|nr:hypothetical protein EDB85DRAFT_1887615 [Lactarius pseudohatsudake]
MWVTTGMVQCASTAISAMRHCYDPAGSLGPKAMERGVQLNQQVSSLAVMPAHGVKGLPAHRAQGQGTGFVVECPGRYWNLREAQGIGYDVTARLQATGHVIGSRRGESQSRVTVTGHVRATGYRKACTNQYKSQSGFTDRARESRTSPKVSPNLSQRNGTRDRDSHPHPRLLLKDKPTVSSLPGAPTIVASPPSSVAVVICCVAADVCCVVAIAVVVVAAAAIVGAVVVVESLGLGLNMCISDSFSGWVMPVFQSQSLVTALTSLTQPRAACYQLPPLPLPPA